MDSDVLIEVTRARNAQIVHSWTELSDSRETVLCSPVSVVELWEGALPKEYSLLADLFQALLCVPIDAKTGRIAGTFLHKYRKSHGVELGDALIAASAIQSGAVLWTQNRKHYPMEELAFFQEQAG